MYLWRSSRPYRGEARRPTWRDRFFLGLTVAALVVAACASSVPAPATTTPPTRAAATTPPASAPAPTRPAASPAVSAAPGATTAGTMADAGKTVYAASCARCHGDRGQGVTGPTVIGPTAQFGRFSTAGDLFEYIRTAMPLDSPGSLSPDKNLQVTAHLLVENGLVQPSETLTEAALGSIKVQK